MNYDQVIDKINALEERLDIILLTMNVGTKGNPKHYEMIDRFTHQAIRRQICREQENEIKSEYRNLKLRLQEIESDYPNLVK